MSETCKHDLAITSCGDCRDGAPFVYISDGGKKFHLSRDCQNLHDGQELVLNRGGEVSKVRAVRGGRAEASGRTPCKMCRRKAASRQREH